MKLDAVVSPLTDLWPSSPHHIHNSRLSAYRLFTMTIVRSPEKQSRMPFLMTTKSTKAQEETEFECQPYFADLSKLPASQIDDLRRIGLIRDGSLDICLLVDKHVEYLQQVWSNEPLKASFVSLDASRTWLIYWTLHACDLLNHQPNDQACENIVDTLSSCWMPVDIQLRASIVQDDPILSVQTTNESVVTIPGGGFGGGPGQIPHAATTYAAVSALCILAAGSTNTRHSQSAFELLEKIRRPLYVWMLSLQEDDGSFRMHHDGEIDV